MAPSGDSRRPLSSRARTILHCLGSSWNWKSAVVSTATRSSIFFVVNVPAGWSAAVHAMVTELAFRGALSGALGALTQSFSRRTTRLWNFFVPVVVLPALAHTAEWLVHHQAGTARLGASIAASVAFSVLTTAFNLFAMRRGALVVGQESQSLFADLRRIPSLIVGFVAAFVRILGDLLRRGRPSRWRTRRFI